MGSSSVFNFFVGVLFVATFVAGDPLEKCQPRNVSYNIGDSKQCDKYHECGTAGKLVDRLCDDGFVYSLEISQCDYPHNVDCSKRALLQPSKSTDPDCPRMNGFYPFPPAVSCQKFMHCLEGKAYEKTCPEGVIFDDTKGACVHPDLATRHECSATELLKFTCPNEGKPFSKLKFGNHDRFRNPADCRKFYICFADGSPRLGGCPIKTVFNSKSGKCDSPKNVPECVNYYDQADHKISSLDEAGLEEIEGGQPDANASKPTAAVTPAASQQKSKVPINHQ
jgi:hypothetical protein